MARIGALRQSILLKRTAGLVDIYRPGNAEQVWQYLRKVLGSEIMDIQTGEESIRVVALSSLGWSLCLPGKKPRRSEPANLVVTLEFDTPAAVERFHDVVKRCHAAEIVGVGADLAIAPVQHWCPGTPPDVTFGTRDDALRAIGAACLERNGLTGKGVNVVVVDQGLDSSQIPDNYGGAWRQVENEAMPESSSEPTPQPSNHGMMVVRNILSIAPEATIFDCPLIPPAISNVLGFASVAQVAYEAMNADIGQAGTIGLPPGPWIFVNAWAVYDRAHESLAGNYTNNPAHPFNEGIGRTVDPGKHDVVFAAGNCGQFCPNARCGAGDRGPGNSILGANAHPKVITTGAVRTDGMWIGYSSQGPGPTNMAEEKPDLCAPSNFRETSDAFVRNTGTSAACGLVAGVVAAIRSKRGPLDLPPGDLKAILLETARGSTPPAWDQRLGYGIIDADAACKAALAADT